MIKKRVMPSQEELNEPGFGNEQKANGHDNSADFAAMFGIGSGGPAETDTTTYTRVQLEAAIKIGRMAAEYHVEKLYAERLRRLEKRLRRVKHALHAVSAEALQN